MKKIINPFDNDLNMCFGCGKKNPLGLKLSFHESEESLHASWLPTDNYQGYPNVLHGGVITTLFDEIGAWCIYIKLGTAGVTTEIKTSFVNPVFISKGIISLTASVSERSDKNATIVCKLTDGQMKVCAQSVAEYFIYPPEVAVKRLRYPGKEAFYEK